MGHTTYTIGMGIEGTWIIDDSYEIDVVLLSDGRYEVSMWETGNSVILTAEKVSKRLINHYAYTA